MADQPQSTVGCPDGAICHHRCLTGCWRVANDSPLPSAYPSGHWSTWTRREYGTVVQDGLPASPAAPAPGGPAPAPVVGPPEPAPGEPAPTDSSPAEPVPSGLASGTPDPEPSAGEVPLLDLTRLLANVGGSVLNLRAQATILRRAADRLDAEADQLRALRDTLNGDT